MMHLENLETGIVPIHSCNSVTAAGVCCIRPVFGLQSRLLNLSVSSVRNVLVEAFQQSTPLKPESRPDTLKYTCFHSFFWCSVKPIFRLVCQTYWLAYKFNMNPTEQ
jgi:hypothetical protein